MTRRAADLGMKALAVTDHGAMYGTIEFYPACQGGGHQADHRHRDSTSPRAA